MAGLIDAMESNQEAFARGTAAGKVEARLDGHDRQLAAINGSVARTADALTELSIHVSDLKLEVQRLRDQNVARDATVLTTAAALKDAEEARRNRSEQAWSTPLKLTAILAGLATVVGTVVGLALLF